MRRARFSDSEPLFRDNPELIARHLNAALATGKAPVIVKAIGEMIRAQGSSAIARKSRLGRESLYRSFSGKMSPSFDRVFEVLLALDVKLVVKSKSETVATR